MPSLYTSNLNHSIYSHLYNLGQLFRYYLTTQDSSLKVHVENMTFYVRKPIDVTIKNGLIHHLHRFLKAYTLYYLYYNPNNYGVLLLPNLFDIKNK